MSRDTFALAKSYEAIFHEQWFENSREPDSELQNLATALEETARERLEQVFRAAARPDASGPWAVIYDVEGTTTPLPFVTKVLYPYSSQHLERFIATTFTSAVINDTLQPFDEISERQRASATPLAKRKLRASDSQTTVEDGGDDEEDVRPSQQLRRTQPQPDSEVLNAVEHRALVNIAQALFAQHGVKPAPHVPLASIHQSMVRALQSEIAANSKSTHLKLLQGRIWREGYETGSIKGHLFDDAAVAMRRLNRAPFSDAVTQHIYSSGSIEAQQLLFRHSTHGDVTDVITSYNDPAKVGPKNDVASYVNLMKAVAKASSGAEPSDMKGFIFLTDSLVEVKAASAAGFVCVLCVRPSNAPLPVSAEEFAVTSDEKLVAVASNFGVVVGALAAVVCGASSSAAIDVLAAQAEVAPYRMRTESIAALKPF